MPKYFLGSVGKAEAFKRDADGNLTLAFVSKTLTDSGINISTTKDDIRAGQGAPVVYSFFHDPNVEITLTDVLWKPEYLEAQIGASFDNKEHIDYKTEKVPFTGGSATLKGEVKAMPIPCSNGKEEYLAWGAKQGSDDWKKITVGEDHKSLTLADAEGGYCVRYLGEEAAAKVSEITATIIPQELFLIITAPIFAGDACAASKGKAAGHITFEVPRFQLNGNQEFSMNMSSNQTMSLSGIAMASTSSDCEAEGGKMLRIIEVINDRDWKADVVQLIVDEEFAKAQKKPSVYGELKDGHLHKIPAEDLEIKVGDGGDFTQVTNETVFATGKVTLRLKGTTLEETLTIA